LAETSGINNSRIAQTNRHRKIQIALGQDAAALIAKAACADECTQVRADSARDSFFGNTVCQLVVHEIIFHNIIHANKYNAKILL
jgi:hypothetical protein